MPSANYLTGSCLQTWGSSVASLSHLPLLPSSSSSSPLPSSLPRHRARTRHSRVTKRKAPMATRPSLRSSDGARPRTKSGAGSGRPPTSPRRSDPSRPSSAAAAAFDKPMPSFLRPTVSSSMHSSSSSSSLASLSASSSSAATARRSADKAPAQHVGASLPITPKDKAKAKAPAPAPASTASNSTLRWSAVSPRQMMQRASNAFKTNTRSSRGKKSKEAAAAASTESSSKGGAGASAARAKGQTARAQPVEEKRQQPETPAEPSPAVTPVETEEPVLLESEDADQNEQDVPTAQEAVGADITTVTARYQEEQKVGVGQPKGKVEEDDVAVEEKIIHVEAEQAKAQKPELQEERPRSSEAVQAETEAQKNMDDGSPAVVVEEAAAKEAATLDGEDELSNVATSTVEEKVVQQEEVSENSEANAISDEDEPEEETGVISEEEEPKEETSVISEEPQEASDPTPLQKNEEVAEEPKAAAGSSVTAPTTPLREVVNDDDGVEAVQQVSASEPATPVAEAIGKGKEATETTQQSASAPATPAGAAKKSVPSKQATIPEPEGSGSASELAFRGSKVKTAMEKRSEEEQPKKKEVARSNDVIEEAKSKLMEKRKSKVKALVGAFETVMDSPRPS